MSVDKVDDNARLKRINEALIARVERSMDQQGNAFTLFQTAINLESRVRAKTDELKQTLRRLEHSNRELSVAKEAAETANASKTRFIAAASHDVLQPLNAARLSVSALTELQQTAKGATLVRQVERSLDTMEELLRTLLDISRLDAGEMQPHLTNFALADVFESLESDFRPLAEKAGLRFTIRPTDAYVVSDRTMLRRVLQNILSNALRYTVTGGVLIGARKRGDTIRIDVVDSGIGIAQDQYERVFDEFHRGPDASAVYGEGLGLGLSIVRRMSDALGHELELTSILGKGSAFRVSVMTAPAPLEKPRQSAGKGNPVYGLSNTKVLLIENDLPVLEAMTALMKRWSCDVRVASHQEAALAVLEPEKWVPEIIIADQHLDFNTLGSETILAVRSHLNRHVPAVIVTAAPGDALSSASRDARIELMQKPLRPAELRALMAHLLA
jgi:two-component system, sensor histidine kinase